MIIVNARLFDRKKDSDSEVRIKNLKPGMYLQNNITLANGVLIAPKGIEIDNKYIQRLQKLSSILDMEQKVSVSKVNP